MSKVQITKFTSEDGEVVVRLSKSGMGWFEVYLGERGQVSALSDYGNYGYVWGAVGGDKAMSYIERLMRFVMRIDPGYALSKFGQGLREVFDGESTEKMIRNTLLDLRRVGEISKDEAREEWDRLDREISSWGEENEGWFYQWADDTVVPDYGECYCLRYPGELKGFVEEVLIKGVQPALQEYFNASPV